MKADALSKFAPRAEPSNRTIVKSDKTDKGFVALETAA